jgi:hypothetical protein
MGDVQRHSGIMPPALIRAHPPGGGLTGRPVLGPRTPYP